MKNGYPQLGVTDGDVEHKLHNSKVGSIGLGYSYDRFNFLKKLKESERINQESFTVYPYTVTTETPGETENDPPVITSTTTQEI